MKICFQTQLHLGFVMHRIEESIKACTPDWVEWVDDWENADLEIVHMIGLGEIKDIHSDPLEKDKIKPKIKNYVVLFHCFDAAGVHIPQWETIFKKANMVYSFHPLDKIYPKLKMNFVLGPWGVNPKTFYDMGMKKIYEIFNTGYVSGSEAIYESYLAARAVGGASVHVGGSINNEVHDTPDPKYYVRKENISDFEMNLSYNQSKYVCGLRRNEGFELPVIEGALAGCRPICFNNPYYTRWFKDLAIFIPEDNNVKENLIKIFKSKYKPVAKEEQKKIIEQFSWETVSKLIFDNIKK